MSKAELYVVLSILCETVIWFNDHAKISCEKAWRMAEI